MPLSGRARLASRSRGPVQQVTTRQTPWAMAALCLHPWMDAPVYCVATAATKKLAHAGDEPCLDGPERSSPSIHPSTHQTGGNISRIDGGHSHVDIWPETRGLGREVCFCLRTDDLQRLVLLCLQSVTLGHAECGVVEGEVDGSCKSLDAYPHQAHPHSTAWHWHSKNRHFQVPFPLDHGNGARSAILLQPDNSREQPGIHLVKVDRGEAKQRLAFPLENNMMA